MVEMNAIGLGVYLVSPIFNLWQMTDYSRYQELDSSASVSCRRIVSVNRFVRTDLVCRSRIEDGRVDLLELPIGFELISEWLIRISFTTLIPVFTK